MGFLDNSGDIILDAVLTDLGRERLARGDGSFKITKFALGDDENNYDKDHVSGSAYYDLEVLQTPVLEAFTNNGSSMRSRLLSLSRNDILYLPVIKINVKDLNAKMNDTEQSYIVAVDETTEDALQDLASNILQGVMYTVQESKKHIEVHQGLDTSDLSPSNGISSDLVETQYLVEVDNRLGYIVSNEGGTQTANVSFVDDDNIAFYYFSTSDTAFYSDIQGLNSQNNTGVSSIAGPRGSELQFKIKANTDLQTGTGLFSRLGSSTTTPPAGGLIAGTYQIINSTVRISGVTTGFRLDIPVKFIKKTA